ncbi:MAG: Ig-like domain-containing protein [Algisphaera sp.]
MGTHTVAVRATDAAGNTSALATVSFELDTQVSTPVIVAVTPDTGLSATDGITHATRLIFTGTADADTTVTLHETTLGTLGSAAADSDGTWTVDATSIELAHGQYNITAVAEDAAGNVSVVSEVFAVEVQSDVADPLPATVAVRGATAGVSSDAIMGVSHILDVTATDLEGDAFDFVTVNWGDGTEITYSSDEDIAHAYVTSGSYTVAVSASHGTQTYVASPLALHVLASQPTPHDYLGFFYETEFMEEGYPADIEIDFYNEEQPEYWRIATDQGFVLYLPGDQTHFQLPLDNLNSGQLELNIHAVMPNGDVLRGFDEVIDIPLAWAANVSVSTQDPETGESLFKALSVQFEDRSELETGYRVRYYALGGGDQGSVLLPAMAGSGSQGQAFLNGLLSGTAYKVFVSAFNETSEGSGGAVQATTLGPTEIYETPNQLTVVRLDATTAELYWADGGSRGWAYDVLSSTDGSAFERIGQVPDVEGRDHRFRIEGLSLGTTHRFQVRATGGWGGAFASPQSNVVQLLNTVATAAPRELTVTSASGLDVELTWDSGNESVDTFVIEQSNAERNARFEEVDRVDGSVNQLLVANQISDNTVYRVHALKNGQPSGYTLPQGLRSQHQATQAISDGLDATAIPGIGVALSWHHQPAVASQSLERREVEGEWSLVRAFDREGDEVAYSRSSKPELEKHDTYVDTEVEVGRRYEYRMTPRFDESTGTASDQDTQAALQSGAVWVVGPEGDEDADGVINRIEYAYGTDYYRADTDRDGLSDAVEIQGASDPTAYTPATLVSTSQNQALASEPALLSGAPLARSASADVQNDHAVATGNSGRWVRFRLNYDREEDLFSRIRQEQWDLRIGNYHLVTPGPGEYAEATFYLQDGFEYEVELVHLGSARTQPYYSWGEAVSPRVLKATLPENRGIRYTPSPYEAGSSADNFVGVDQKAPWYGRYIINGDQIAGRKPLADVFALGHGYADRQWPTIDRLQRQGTFLKYKFTSLDLDINSGTNTGFGLPTRSNQEELLETQPGFERQIPFVTLEDSNADLLPLVLDLPHYPLDISRRDVDPGLAGYRTFQAGLQPIRFSFDDTSILIQTADGSRVYSDVDYTPESLGIVFAPASDDNQITVFHPAKLFIGALRSLNGPASIGVTGGFAYPDRFNDEGGLTREAETLVYEDAIHVKTAPAPAITIAVDADRDGFIRVDGSDATTEDTPFAFWFNDDRDTYLYEEPRLNWALGNTFGEAYAAAVDVVPSNGLVADNATSFLGALAPIIEGAAPTISQEDMNRQILQRDLEDLFAVSVVLPADIEEQGASVRIGLESNSGNAATARIHDYNGPAVLEGLEMDSKAHLINDETISEIENSLHVYNAGKNADRYLNIDSESTREIDRTWIQASVYDLASGQVILPLLIEGLTAQNDEFDGRLVVELVDALGNVLTTSFLNLQLRSIRKFYEYWTVGDENNIAHNHVSNTAVRDTDSSPTSERVNYTDEYLLLVHGWRMRPEDKRMFADTAYKRSWWSGYEGRFDLFSWPTEYTEDPVYDKQNYDRSERIAYESGEGLRNFVWAELGKYEGNVDVVAHSMGNIVVSEALRQEAESEWRQEIVDIYVASQSAVAAHAYDANASTTNPDDWANTPNVYAVYPETGKPYFADINKAAGAIIRYYNPKDAATSDFPWGANQNTKPDQGWSYTEGTDTWIRQGAGVEAPTVLRFPEDTYEIFAHIAEAKSKSVGSAEAAVGGPFDDSRSEDLGGLLKINGSYISNNPADHSAQFNHSYRDMKAYWDQLLTDILPPADDLPLE